MVDSRRQPFVNGARWQQGLHCTKPERSGAARAVAGILATFPSLSAGAAFVSAACLFRASPEIRTH